MKELKERLFYHWNTTRILRVVLGLMVVWYGLDASDQTIFVAGIILAVLPLMNVPCMVFPMHFFRKRKKVAADEEIQYTEL